MTSFFIIAILSCQMSSVGKRIVQTTFDDVVRENIEDLEMDPPEAIADAIEQFTAQVDFPRFTFIYAYSLLCYTIIQFTTFLGRCSQ